MLDLFVFKDPLCPGRLGWKPYVKPSARHIPLSCDSCHAEHVHKSWPVSEIRRMYNRSKRVEDFEVARGRMLQRFEYFYMRHDILEACRSWQPSPRSFVAQAALAEHSRPAVFSPVIFRLVIGFHPCWKHVNLAGALNQTLVEWGPRLQAIWRRKVSFCFQVAFRNDLRPLVHRLR